jgi:DedD protein
MLTRPEAADPAVEELKRRARRRLVGAVVLALAAAVILPLLLESDPKPLGEDVSIQIPPIDNGKFVTQLSPVKGTDAKAAPDAATMSAPTVSPKPAVAAPGSAIEPKESGTAPANSKPVEPAQAAPIDVPASAGAAPIGGVAAAPEPQKPPPAAAKAAPGDVRPDAASPSGGLVVQMAAFADAKAAPALASKLKSAGFPAYVETVQTAKGAMKRVRVGPYATREIADAQAAKLKAAGYRGVVTAK